MLDLQSLIDSINNDETIIVCSHERPDADAIGAQVAFTRYLQNIGKLAFALMPDRLPAHFYSIISDTKITQISSLHSLNQDNCYCFALDCAEITRINDCAINFFDNDVTLNLDHHPDNTSFATINCVSVSASSTCEIIADYFKMINYSPDVVSADALFGGIISDSGNFLYSCTSTKTLDAAKFLMSNGAKPFIVADRLYSNNSIARLKLLSLYLDRLELSLDGFFATSFLNHNDYIQFGDEKISTDGFVNQPFSVGSVQVSVFLDVNLDGSIKGSIRSKWPHVIVNKIAQKFGGGGHKSAAGFKVSAMTLSNLKTALLHEVDSLKRNITSS